MEIETLTEENGIGTADADIPETEVPDTPTEGEDSAADAAEGAAEEEQAKAEPERDFAALAARDLSVLCEAFPELADMQSLGELPEPERYGELREAGLSPIEAFCASHHKILMARRADNRAHLSPSVGRAANAAGGRISAAALSDARDLFPSLSDREIEALYRRVSTTR